MPIWDSKLFWNGRWPQDSKRFLDTYKKNDGELLLDGMRIWDSKLF